MAQLNINELNHLGHGASLMENKKWHTKDKIMVVIYVITTAFWFGVSYASFATKDYVDGKDKEAVAALTTELKVITMELKELNKQVAEVRAGKVDKPNPFIQQ